PARLSLAGLPSGTYLLHVTNLAPAGTTGVVASGPATYDLQPVFAQPGARTHDLSVAPLGVDGATGLPTLGYANALLDVDRRDVLLGGDGNDVISAGTAETWVFGGAGNDVLTSGSDHNGGDLLWGGAGD